MDWRDVQARHLPSLRTRLESRSLGSVPLSKTTSSEYDRALRDETEEGGNADGKNCLLAATELMAGYTMRLFETVLFRRVAKVKTLGTARLPFGLAPTTQN